ncbi:Cin1p RNJ42_04777 [Nakaseomyces bracarensis]|uniref:Cin1p n=1 Tax=Nakaseomyces bracarensis TaxID=273131 RepID=UPI00387277D8
MSIVLIEDGIRSIESYDIEVLIRNIDEFQQDPSLLEPKLSGFIKLLCADFFHVSIETQLRIATVFYTLSKVCSHKRTCIQLPSDIYYTHRIIEKIKDYDTIVSWTTDNILIHKWHYLYLLWSWLQLISMSPMVLADHKEILTFVQSFQTNNKHFLTLAPILSRTVAELTVKDELTLHEYCTVLSNKIETVEYNNLLTIDNILRIINKSNLHFEKYSKDEKVINLFSVISIYHSKSLVHSERSSMILAKIFPRLTRIYLHNSDWEKIEDVISWYLNNLNSNFSEVRFALANSYRKIVDTLVAKLEPEDILPDLLQTRLREIVLIFNNNSWDNIDTDHLHSLLLLIAFNMKTINNELPFLINDIIEKVVPKASRFQQMRLNVIQGKQIRDASNFICWSLSRCQNIDAEMISPIILHLLISSLFDHDFLIRKSANAALQEALGRKGSKVLDNNAILEIIQLPISDLNTTFSGNLIKLFSILGHDAPQFFSFILNWLINFGIFENLRLDNVLLAITALVRLINAYPTEILDTFSVKETLLELAKSKNSMSKIQQSKLLYLLLKLNIVVFREDVLTLESTLCEALLASSKKKPSNDEYFIYLTIFEFWFHHLNNGSSYCLSEEECKLFFHILRSMSIQSFGFEVVDEKCKHIVRNLSRQGRFETDAAERYFWAEFKKFLRLNNFFINASLPFINSDHFFLVFSEVLPHLNCESKSAILDSLNPNLKSMVNGSENVQLLSLLVRFLDDYTITEQGDVGRLVRHSALKLVSDNFTVFMTEGNSLQELALSSIVRLVAEPASIIREKAMEFLVKHYTIDDDLKIDKKHDMIALELLELFTGDLERSFWWGYVLSGGAIYSTDEQLVESLDSFLQYYDLQEEEMKLQICNNLVRIIPNSKTIIEYKNRKAEEDEIGIIRYDLIKFTISALNFWRRILESNLNIPPSFNFQGFYAKIYNIHLISFNNNLKSSSIKLFPLLCISYQNTNNNDIRAFSNTVLKRLIFLLKRDIKERNSKKKLKKLCMEAILQILISYQAHAQLKNFQNTEDMDNQILSLPDSEILI